MKYGFFPGCTLEAAASEAKIATLKVAEALGIELIELKGWTCCGATHLQDYDSSLAVAVNARNIGLSEKLGLPVLTVCNTCTLMLRKAKHKLDNEEGIKDEVNIVLKEAGLEYRGTSEVTHLLWVLLKDYGLEKLKTKIKKPLKGVKVANFYGCHIIRPAHVLGFENPQNPRSMEKLVENLGAESVDFSSRLDCCGFHAVFPAEQDVLRLSGIDTSSAKDAGAHCMLTPCPLCQMQLDMYQPDSAKKLGRKIDMPVLHLAQLVGLALGISPKELAMDQHIIDAKGLLKVL